MIAIGSTMAVGLAAVFALAAVLKLVSPAKTTREFRALELPVPAILATAVPVAELTVAFDLVFRPRQGAMLALVLLGAFTAVIVRTVRSGLEVSCGCLGSVQERPVSWDAVVRNAVLAVMAVLATAAPALTRPGLAPVLVFVGFCLITVVGAQLFALQQIIGRVWSVELAGEAPQQIDLRKEMA